MPLCGLNMSREITFIVGHSEITLSEGVHSRLEQTSHILLDTTPTQNGMNTSIFFSYLSKTWPRLKPDESVKTVNMLNNVTGGEKKEFNTICRFLMKKNDFRKTEYLFQSQFSHLDKEINLTAANKVHQVITPSYSLESK